MIDRNKIRKLERQMRVTIYNKSGKKVIVDRGDIKHMKHHIANMIQFIDIILSYDYNRKIPIEYASIICFEFNFNLITEVEKYIRSIDPELYCKLESYLKTLSILSNQKRIDKSLLFDSLSGLKIDLLDFCSLFKDFMNIENCMKDNNFYTELLDKDAEVFP